MSTLVTALEPIFAEEGNSETAVTARFVKVAGVFAQFPDSTINDASDIIKSDEVRRLAMGGWLLHTYGATKDTKSAVYKMAQLGKSEVFRSVIKANSWDSVKEAYKKATARLAKRKSAERQERKASGERVNALLKVASNLGDDDLVIIPTDETDDQVKALKAFIKRYDAAKKPKVASAPELLAV